MKADSPDVEWTTCEDCGRSFHAGYAADHDGYCPRCHRSARIDAARSDIDEAKGELESLAGEMADLRERMAAAKDAIRSARARLATLKS